MQETILPNGVIRKRKNVEREIEVSAFNLLKMDILGISQRRLNALIEKETTTVIPDGYTVKADNSGDCYECAFCKVTGHGEDSEMDCDHPTPKSTGCVDLDIVFVIADEN